VVASGAGERGGSAIGVGGDACPEAASGENGLAIVYRPINRY
jgi:hypothetical protein